MVTGKRYWINYGLNKDPSKNKNNFYWSYLNVFKSIHFMQNTSFKLWGFSQPGLQEIGGEMEKKWSKTYRKSPYLINKTGFYYSAES